MNNDERKIILDELEAKVTRLQKVIDLWSEVGFPRKTIIVLLAHYTKLPQRQINLVLEGIDALYGSTKWRHFSSSRHAECTARRDRLSREAQFESYAS